MNPKEEQNEGTLNAQNANIERRLEEIALRLEDINRKIDWLDHSITSTRDSISKVGGLEDINRKIDWLDCSIKLTRDHIDRAVGYGVRAAKYITENGLLLKPENNEKAENTEKKEAR